MAIIDRLKTELNITSVGDEALLENCVWQADLAVKNKRGSKNISQYEYIVYQVALRLWNTRGVEGQTAHNENGISRNYLSDGVIIDLLRQVPALSVTGGIPNA